LGFTVTAFARCTEITRDIGGVSGRIGICGVEISITEGLVGSGAGTERLAGTNIVYASSGVGMVHVGTTSAVTGIFTAEIITTTISMVGTDGLGAVIGALESTCTVCEPCTATIRVTGVVFAPTGTCGDAITTTNDLVGSGASTARLDVTCIDCAS